MQSSLSLWFPQNYITTAFISLFPGATHKPIIPSMSNILRQCILIIMSCLSNTSSNWDLGWLNHSGLSSGPSSYLQNLFIQLLNVKCCQGLRHIILHYRKNKESVWSSPGWSSSRLLLAQSLLSQLTLLLHSQSSNLSLSVAFPIAAYTSAFKLSTFTIITLPSTDVRICRWMVEVNSLQLATVIQRTLLEHDTSVQ